MTRLLAWGLAVLALLMSAPASAQTEGPKPYRETPSLAEAVTAGRLLPVEARVPDEPLVIDLEAMGRATGRHGGSLRTLVGRDRDIRLMVVYGYARLAGYTPDFEIEPDLLRALTVSEDGLSYTLHLRKGHRWSDGHPFTAEDFRYWWQDVANNRKLSPAGPPVDLFAGGKPPRVEIIDMHTVRYSWDVPNPKFPSLLAQARPPFIYRPAHYMKQFHIDYTSAAAMAPLIEKEKVSSWAALHNRYDNLYKYDNPDLPSLQPWVVTTRPPSTRFIFERNPFFHRVDTAGQQLPYIDRVVMDVVEPRLIAAKSNAGETDLQARGLVFSNIPILKKGEARHGYAARLWQIGKASHFALYPNLNVNDPAWRSLNRDARFRKALSLAIDRRMINEALFFGLAIEGNNTLLPQSPLFQNFLVNRHADYAPDEANRLLDDIGLTRKRGDGIRLLPDGRPLEIIVETAGESPEETDILELIGETWRDIGIKLFIKPSDRTNLRNRVYAGLTVMSAWPGWDNGLATANMSPRELAPVEQSNLAWPKWGQHFETKGKLGEPVDMAAPKELLALKTEWETSPSQARRADIWEEMLRIHAEHQFVIGTVNSVAQPIVVSNRLRNVPENGVYSWDPGAHFGIYRPDQFWFAAE